MAWKTLSLVRHLAACGDGSQLVQSCLRAEDKEADIDVAYADNLMKDACCRWQVYLITRQLTMTLLDFKIPLGCTCLDIISLRLLSGNFRKKTAELEQQNEVELQRKFSLQYHLGVSFPIPSAQSS